jgi:hypothetical protein
MLPQCAPTLLLVDAGHSFVSIQLTAIFCLDVLLHTRVRILNTSPGKRLTGQATNLDIVTFISGPTERDSNDDFI